MNKKGIALGITLALLVGGYVGGCVLTGMFYDKAWEAQLEQLNQQPGMQWQWQDTAHSLRQRDGILTVNLDTDRVAKSFPMLGDQPLTLVMKVHQSVEPLFLRGEAEFDSHQGSLGGWLKQIQMNELPHSIRWSINALTQGFTGHIRFDPWKWAGQGNRIEFAQLDVQTAGRMNQHGRINLDWEGLSAGDESQQLVHLAPVHTSMSMKNQNGIWLSDDYQFRFDGIRLVSPEQRITLQNLTGQGSLVEHDEVDNKRFDLNFSSQVKAIELAGTAHDLNINNLMLALSINDLDQQGYLAMMQLANQPQPDQWQALTVLQQLLSKGLSVKLGTLSLDYNKANVRAQGNLAVAGNQGPILGLPQLLARLHGKLALVATPELVAQIPNGSNMLSPMLAQGYVKRSDDGSLQTELRIDGGKASANGVALPF